MWSFYQALIHFCSSSKTTSRITSINSICMSHCFQQWYFKGKIIVFISCRLSLDHYCQFAQYHTKPKTKVIRKSVVCIISVSGVHGFVDTFLVLICCIVTAFQLVDGWSSHSGSCVMIIFLWCFLLEFDHVYIRVEDGQEVTPFFHRLLVNISLWVCYHWSFLCSLYILYVTCHSPNLIRVSLFFLHCAL
jgi:hypothetical protein